jgi:hypothetical protein
MRMSRRDGKREISVEHPQPAIAQVLLMEALGTLDRDFLIGLMAQLADAGQADRDADGRGLNFMLAMVKGIKPRDQIECMLAAQMAAVHIAAMASARSAALAARASPPDGAAAGFSKLARTFAAQIEALKRYRCGGGQKVLVERVTVNDGGQAIVGQVGIGGREYPWTTSCTGAAGGGSDAGAGCATENPRTTSCTGAAGGGSDAPATRAAENPRTTPCTGAAAGRGEADACSTAQNAGTTP